jgi:hypothetical protein
MSLTDEQSHTGVSRPAADRAAAPDHRPPGASGLIVLAVITLVIAAVAFANRGAAPANPAVKAETQTRGRSPVPPSGLVPSSTAHNGIAVGHPHTQAGAASAATNYVVALGSAQMFRTGPRHELIKTIADPTSEPQLQERFDRSYSATLATFGLDNQGNPPRGMIFVSRALPVGTHLVSYADDRAVVEVWSAGLIGLAGEKSTKPVAEAWSTTTVTLRWVNQDWKWVSSSHREGPTPVNGLQSSSSSQDIARAVEQFGELRYAR